MDKMTPKRNAAGSRARPPNILLIVSDHHPARLGGFGGHPHVKTPALDALAAEGVVFTQAYSNCPVCGPARSCYMSGRYNFEVGHWSNGVPVPADLRTWAQRVGEAGMTSTLLGKIDFPGVFEGAGFSRVRLACRRAAFQPYPRVAPEAWAAPGFRRHQSRDLLCGAGPAVPDGYHDPSAWYNQSCGLYDQDRTVTDWALAYLADQAVRPDEPWVLHVGYEYPHWPYKVPARYFNRYWPDNVDLPHNPSFPNPQLPPAVQEFQQWNAFGEVTDEMLRRVRAAFYGMITCLDDMIGELVSRLKATGQYENTVIIYTSDHGDSMGDHGLFFKLSPMEGSIGVPLLMRGPDLPAGATVEAPVSLLDLYRTVLDLAGLEAEPDVHGESWLPLARGEQAGRDEPVFVEYHGVGFRGAWYVLRRGDWKYTWYEYFPATLHNLREDPHEVHDVSGDPRQAGRLQRFERELRSICHPKEVSMRAKVMMGLVTAAGQDLTADPDAYGYHTG